MSVYINPSEKCSNRNSSQKYNLIFPKNFESILKKAKAGLCVCVGVGALEKGGGEWPKSRLRPSAPGCAVCCGWQRNSGASQELMSRTRLGTLAHSLEGEVRVPTQMKEGDLLDLRNYTYRSHT